MSADDFVPGNKLAIVFPGAAQRRTGFGEPKVTGVPIPARISLDRDDEESPYQQDNRPREYPRAVRFAIKAGIRRSVHSIQRE